MRLFVGLPVPEEVQAVLLDGLGDRSDDRVAWTRPEGWHVTMAFVGEVDDGRLDAVRATTADGISAAGGPDRIELATTTVTTLRRRALVIDLADGPAGVVARLGRSIQQALSAGGFDVQQRRVAPHLTLARARRRGPIPMDLVRGLVVPETTWTVDEVAVVESILSRGPARYTVRSTCPLSVV